ncbi:hypothetical protein MKZ38_004981 [Zalerion maritima]|uniref:Uncharacterized protein n=1 Tax=Zalerion maritima TaxID=339359 RepID=A0AAD5WP90_9PEZI|nr:hypothetical protein MKZ38_004981 [Zalerion maritima]
MNAENRSPTSRPPRQHVSRNAPGNPTARGRNDQSEKDSNDQPPAMVPDCSIQGIPVGFRPEEAVSRIAEEIPRSSRPSCSQFESSQSQESAQNYSNSHNNSATTDEPSRGPSDSNSEDSQQTFVSQPSFHSSPENAASPTANPSFGNPPPEQRPEVQNPFYAWQEQRPRRDPTHSPRGPSRRPYPDEVNPDRDRLLHGQFPRRAPRRLSPTNQQTNLSRRPTPPFQRGIPTGPVPPYHPPDPIRTVDDLPIQGRSLPVAAEPQPFESQLGLLNPPAWLKREADARARAHA